LHAVARGVCAAVWASSFSSIVGCGEITCPEPLSLVDGSCQKLDADPDGGPEAEVSLERCDGIDNDGDEAIDEDWPARGEPCGDRAGVGTCVSGVYACAPDGGGLVCDGAVLPSAEVCDGKDNDCDGVVDEGALSVKHQTFGDRATVAAVEGGFVVSRVLSDRVRVETYDTQGNSTGLRDDADKPTGELAFIESDASDKRVLVALGQHSFHALDVHVDSELVPIVIDERELHGAWRQGIDFGVYDPPYHPRVVASPPRFVGYRDLITFALSPFSQSDLSGLEQEPVVASEVPLYSPFDAAGAFVLWEQGGNLRAGWLLDDGAMVLDIDVGRGHTPAVGMRSGGPGVAYLQEGELFLSELGGLSLQCVQGRLCHARLDAEELRAEQLGPTALAYDEAADVWFVAAGRELLVVGRGEASPVVKQVEVLDALASIPQRIDVAVSGGTAAVVHTSQSGASALTFLGCF
jgi:hypothetical protein